MNADRRKLAFKPVRVYYKTRAQRKIPVVLHFPSVKSALFTDGALKILTVFLRWRSQNDVRSFCWTVLLPILILRSWHKASCASPSDVASAACFEELAGVYASSGAYVLS